MYLFSKLWQLLAHLVFFHHQYKPQCDRISRHIDIIDRITAYVFRLHIKTPWLVVKEPSMVKDRDKTQTRKYVFVAVADRSQSKPIKFLIRRLKGRATKPTTAK